MQKLTSSCALIFIERETISMAVSLSKVNSKLVFVYMKESYLVQEKTFLYDMHQGNKEFINPKQKHRFHIQLYGYPKP